MHKANCKSFRFASDCVRGGEIKRKLNAKEGKANVDEGLHVQTIYIVTFKYL